ncbi:MAG: hypothetical protein FWD48_05320 [Oscillospiraceae bacterium]|nr:hypothetical protein [Oscillospiraceae bacterium]
MRKLFSKLRSGTRKFASPNSNIISVPIIFLPLTKLGLDGLDGDKTGITDMVADFVNGAWDIFLDVIRTILYALLVVPLMITSALSDAVDVVSGIKPVYTEEEAIYVPHAGTYPLCRYDDFIVFDTFYFVENGGAFKNNRDGTRNVKRFGFRETVPGPLFGDWVAYREVPNHTQLDEMYWLFGSEMRNGTFINDFLRNARQRDRMLKIDGTATTFPAPYVHEGQTYYGRSLDGPNVGVLTRPAKWKGEDEYRFTSNQDFASYFIAHTLYRNGYEPENYDYRNNHDLLPYYMTQVDAFNLRDNKLNRHFRSNTSPGRGRWQFSGYNPEFFAHIQCRQQYYYVEQYGGFVRGVKNYYSIMYLYSAKPLWRDYIDHMEGVKANGTWTPEFLEYLKEHDLAPGSEEMYRFVANQIAEGIQIYAPVVNSGGGETLLSILLGQSIISYAFWGITLISAALCLLFTIIAVTRSMGDLELKRPIGKVMGDTAKAMLTFLLIPIMMIVAVNLSMTVLRQINMVMDNAIVGDDANQNINMATAIFYTSMTKDSMMFTRELDALIEVSDTEEARRLQREGYSPTEAEKVNKLATTRQALLTGRLNWMSLNTATHDVDPFFMNYLPTMITAWFSVVIMTMILLLFIQRIYDMLLLYLAAPFFVSAIPLDEGQKFKSWREMFIAKTIEGFSSIITLKLFLIFMPLLWNGTLAFHYNDVYDLLIKCLFMIGGLYATYKSHTLITGLFNKQAEAMEKETSAVGQQIVNAAKDTVMAPLNMVKENIQDDVNKKIGSARQSAAHGLRDFRNSAVDKTFGAAGRGIKSAVGGLVGKK